MQINNLYDVQILMFVLIVPLTAIFLICIFGALGILLEVFKGGRPQTAKIIVIVAGVILVAWLLYTWKSGERTEANRALIQRLERDYNALRGEFYGIKRKDE